MLSPDDRDAVIKTIWGEAADQPTDGQLAVAHVIQNRMASGNFGGDTASSVVHYPNAFEPWSTASGRARMNNIPAQAYARLGGMVDDVFSGNSQDPTGGATHFYAPTLQAQLGRSTPSWANGPSVKIGDHVFFKPDGTPLATSNSQGAPQMADPGALFQLAQNNNNGSGFDFGQMAAGLQDAGAGLMSINNPAALAGTNHLAAYRNKMTPQLVESGTDPFTGQKTFALFNPGSQSLIQMNANGQVSSSGGAPSGNTLQAFRQAMLDGKTGDELLQYAPPEARSYIEALKRGDANPMYMGRGVGGAQRAALNEMAHAIYPDMTDANIEARKAEAKNLATSNNPSTLGGAIAAMGKVSLHGIDLMKASEDLSKLQAVEQSTVANTGQNILKNLSTDTNYKTAVNKLNAAAALYAREADRVTSGGHPTLTGQQEISSLFSPNKSHEERFGALQQTLGMAQDATDQLVYNNNRAFGRIGTPDEKKMEDFMSPATLKAWNTIKTYNPSQSLSSGGARVKYGPDGTPYIQGPDGNPVPYKK